MTETLSSSLRLRAARDADGPAVADLVTRVLAEHGLAADPQGTDRDLAHLEATYLASGGIFLVLEDAAGRLVGSVGLLPLPDGAAELRKMYFEPALRGRGVGRALLAHVLGLARDSGFTRVVLETASPLVRARRLYAAAGFVEQPQGAHAARCDRSFSLALADWLPPVGGPLPFRIER